MNAGRACITQLLRLCLASTIHLNSTNDQRTGSVGRQRVVTGGAAVARIGAMAASSTTWVATPEAYPTAVTRGCACVGYASVHACQHSACAEWL